MLENQGGENNISIKYLVIIPVLLLIKIFYTKSQKVVKGPIINTKNTQM